MATERQIAANRRNAAKSTGPTSQAGKMKSARNSFRHGLATVVAQDPVLGAQAQSLATIIVAGVQDAEKIAAARDFAEATFDLLRIRKLRAWRHNARSRLLESRQFDAVEFDEDLARILRYEKRAYARRSHALKVLERFC
jgi:hypothetical protein